MSSTAEPPSQRSAARPIVVGVDGSAPSLDALRWAARLSAALALPIEVVACWHFPPYYGYGGADATWRPDQDSASLLAGALTSVFGDARPDGLTEAVREGHPAEVLIGMSAGAELLVVGSRGHGGFAGLLLGSVSAYCAEHAECPVVVVRRKDPTD